MKYVVELQPSAANDIERGYRNLQERAGEGKVWPDYPEQWYEQIEEALFSLEEFPARCPLAPEAEKFQRPLRHLILKNSYRIIFEVRETTVWVLHIRHQRQKPLEPRD